MQAIENNNQKYNNYKTQMGRLYKAQKAEFFLESIFIEAAIIEDRVESILRASGVYRPEKQNTLNKKLSRISELQRNKKGILKNYISVELIESIHEWKNERNKLVHALLKQETTAEELKEFSERGLLIVKTLNSKVTSYRRKMEKENP